MTPPLTAVMRDQLRLRIAETRGNPYVKDPVGWVTDTTGEYLWSKQREILEAVVKYRKVAVRAGHGVGKSMSASRLGAWWVETHPAKDTWLVTTAPTWEQVQNIYWQELQMAHGLGSLTGQITGDCKWRKDKLLVGMGRKPSDYNAHAFQGLHRDYVLVVIDEACGVAGTIWEGADNITTGEHCRTLAIGNPDDPSSHFADICKGAPEDGTSGMSSKGWWVIEVSVLDSPTFTDEQVPDDVRRRMPSVSWLDGKRLQYGGETSALWMSKVLGRFPKDASDGVIPNSWLRACMLERDWTGTQLQPVELGIDVGASDNGDQTVVRERRGAKLGRVWRYRERDHTKLAPHILGIIQETGATAVKIDATGAGHGLANMITDYGTRGLHHATVHELNFGASAVDSTRFANVRAELHWSVRELVQTQAVDLSVLGTEDGGDGVIAELIATRQLADATGRVKCEPKAQVSARLSRSPDDADAVLLAYYVPTAVVREVELEVEYW